MALPNIDQLNEFFGSITLNNPQSPDYEEANAIPETVGSHIRKTETNRKPLKFWARKQAISIASGTEKIRKELKKTGHADLPEAATVILALLAMSKAEKLSPVDRVNAILAAVCPAKVSDALISLFSPPPEAKPFSVGDLRLGVLQREQLVYWCEKVGHPYFAMNPDHFVGRFAIERSQLQTVQVLDLTRAAEELSIAVTEDLKLLTDFYFHRLTQHRRETLFDEFVRDQAVAVAMGAPYIVPEQSLMFLGSTFISIYRDMGAKKKGYLCTVDTTPVLEFAQADRRYPIVLGELKDAYGFSGVTSSEIHQTLFSYCRFLLKAKVHLDHGRIDEAFLHYIIALDLLFGEKDASTHEVSTRAAVVTHRALGKSYAEVVKLMKSVYSARSKYVHEGSLVEEGMLTAVIPVAEEVVRCLLRVQKQPQSKSSGFVEHWLKQLTFLVAGIEAGRTIEDSEFVAVGIK